MTNNSSKSFFVFLLGAAAGTALGLLFAPKKGEETREEVSAWLKDKREASAEALHEWREKSGEALHDLKEKSSEVVTDIRERFPKAGREALRRTHSRKETIEA